VENNDGYRIDFETLDVHIFLYFLLLWRTVHTHADRRRHSCFSPFFGNTALGIGVFDVVHNICYFHHSEGAFQAMGTLLSIRQCSKTGGGQSSCKGRMERAHQLEGLVEACVSIRSNNEDGGWEMRDGVTGMDTLFEW
jgi:hypothetical protein